MSQNCLFCKIIHGDIAAHKLYEDAHLVAFLDIRPVAKTHFLVVPKRHIESLLAVVPEDQTLLGQLLLAAPRLAREQGLEEGFRTIINSGKKGGQSVFHLHIHVFGGGGKAESLMDTFLA